MREVHNRNASTPIFTEPQAFHGGITTSAKSEHSLNAEPPIFTPDTVAPDVGHGGITTLVILLPLNASVLMLRTLDAFHGGITTSRTPLLSKALASILKLLPTFHGGMTTSKVKGSDPIILIP